MSERARCNASTDVAKHARAGLVFFALIACHGAEQPYQPAQDLAPLRAAYERPSAELTAVQLQSLLGGQSVRLIALALSDRLKFLRQAIDQAKLGFEDKGFEAAKALELQGRADVTVNCPGDVAIIDLVHQVPDPGNGTLTFRIPISNSRLGPGADGTAASCRFGRTPAALPSLLAGVGVLGSSPVELHGPISIDFGAALTLGESVILQPLFVVHGELRVGGLPALTGFDFRLPADGRVEMRVDPGSAGNVVVYAQGVDIGVRERRGVWLCQGASLLCAAQF
ncbi:MAG TPA: hypothetical protein VJV79_07740 [Polyangiaceae bacterium]|nr:hypothetical protein [Polyangiaceae bacterium]